MTLNRRTIAGGAIAAMTAGRAGLAMQPTALGYFAPAEESEPEAALGVEKVICCVALSIAILGCGPGTPGFDTLHPRVTGDCSRHIDGSFYGIGGRMLGGNDVGAIVFRMGTSPPLIEITYSIVNGDAVRLDSRRFTALSASGEAIAEAKPALLLNPLVDGEDPKLGELPFELKGDGRTRGRDVHPAENRTLYRVVVTFDQVLPAQFDLRSPDVWLKDKKYPVRIFGFRNFPGKGLGLCQ